MLFLDYLNIQHPSIRFTKEENIDNELPFLDILISNRDGCKTSVYHKPTYTGLLTNFKSFAPHEYKKRLVNTLLDRTYKINSSWGGFDIDVKSLSKSLLRNLYPKRFIDKCIKTFLNKKLENKKQTNINNNNDDNNDVQTRYITLPYIGDYSKVTKNKIKNLVKTLSNGKINIKLVFTTCKIKSYFSNKDQLPKCFKSNVVYLFNCARCKSCYVGRTHIHFNTRLNQHLGSDKKSSVHKHLNNNNECKKVCDADSFKVLDNAKSSYELALKEGMHIKWLNPVLNVQKKHEILKLRV